MSRSTAPAAALSPASGPGADPDPGPRLDTLAARLTWAIEHQPGPGRVTREQIEAMGLVSTVSIWKAEAGRTLHPRWLGKVAPVLKANFLWLLTGQGERHVAEVNGMQVHRAAAPRGALGENYRVLPLDVRVRELPLINIASAGSYCEAFEAALGNPGDHKLIACPIPCGPRSFWVRVVGRSMTSPTGDTYNEGDLIALDCDKDPVPGKPVIARVPTGECTLKNYELEGDGTPFLLALNPDWPDRRTPMPEGTEVCAAFVCRVSV